MKDVLTLAVKRGDVVRIGNSLICFHGLSSNDAKISIYAPGLAIDRQKFWQEWSPELVEKMKEMHLARAF